MAWRTFKSQSITAGRYLGNPAVCEYIRLHTLQVLSTFFELRYRRWYFNKI